MNRKLKQKLFILFVIVSAITLIVVAWNVAWWQGLAKANNQMQSVEVEEALGKQPKQGENNEQADMINKTIQEVAKEQERYDEYTFIGSFHEGLARASKEVEGSLWRKYGYIDTEGKEVIAFKYEWVNNFSDGLASVSEDGEKYGYIDHQGNWVIEPILDCARDFEQGEARVQVGINWYIIDKEGNILEEESKS
ncbi:MAG: WG repeat-containing protein [Clostridia bacterium]|nr:WG repeat-containing protein [Clostridia bacterium]